MVVTVDADNATHRKLGKMADEAQGARDRARFVPVACVIMTRAWVLPVLFVVCGFAVATALVVRGSPSGAAAPLLVFVLLAWLNSPLVFPKSIGAAEAQRRTAIDGQPIVYWRPGCPYCLRLRIRLGRSGRRLHWVDIWRDPAGAAAVRAANDGDETVPTVVVAGQTRVNPDPKWVRAQLSRPVPPTSD